MSKSKGDILTISLIEKQGYDPLAFRFMCLGSHYRKQLLFTYDNLDQAQNTLNKLRNKIRCLKDDGSLDENLFETYVSKFKEALENDLNTSNALAVLYEILKDNVLNDFTKKSLIANFDQVLSLDLMKEEDSIDSELDSEIKKFIEERSEAKKNKDFATADKIRDDLLARGIKLIDTREGTTYELIKD